MSFTCTVAQSKYNVMSKSDVQMVVKRAATFHPATSTQAKSWEGRNALPSSAEGEGGKIIVLTDKPPPSNVSLVMDGDVTFLLTSYALAPKYKYDLTAQTGRMNHVVCYDELKQAYPFQQQELERRRQLVEVLVGDRAEGEGKGGCCIVL